MVYVVMLREWVLSDEMNLTPVAVFNDIGEAHGWRDRAEVINPNDSFTITAVNFNPTEADL